jgi:hypothetical protein
MPPHAPAAPAYDVRFMSAKRAARVVCQNTSQVRLCKIILAVEFRRAGGGVWQNGCRSKTGERYYWAIKPTAQPGRFLRTCVCKSNRGFCVGITLRQAGFELKGDRAKAITKRERWTSSEIIILDIVIKGTF